MMAAEALASTNRAFEKALDLRERRTASSRIPADRLFRGLVVQYRFHNSQSPNAYAVSNLGSPDSKTCTLRPLDRPGRILDAQKCDLLTADTDLPIIQDHISDCIHSADTLAASQAGPPRLMRNYSPSDYESKFVPEWSEAGVGA